ERLGNQLAVVHQDRNGCAVFGNSGRYVRAALFAGGIEHEELDALLLEAGAQLVEVGGSRSELLVAIALDKKGHCLVIVVVAELVKVTLMIQQGEVTAPF